MASNADQKNEARRKREAAVKAAEAAQKRNRNLQILAGVIFSALVVVVLVVLLSGGNSDKAPKGIGEDESSEVAGVQATKDLFAGIEQRSFSLGDPKAPVTIIEFVDMQCPFCRDHELDEQPTVIKELVRTGKAKLRLAPVAILGVDSQDARIVLTKLAAKNKAWNFSNLFYFNQGSENTGYVTDAYLSKLVSAAGGTASDADRASNAAVDAKLKEIDELASSLNVSSTPSFAIGKTGDQPDTFKIVEAGPSTADSLIDETNKLIEAGT